MMNKIKQHRPAYFTGFETLEVEFDDLDSLLDIEWVKNFTKCWDSDNTFYRFSVVREDNYGYKLMAELNEGKKWWVVGFINTDVEELPDWSPKYDDDKIRS